jgi:hypothetical protein
MGRTYYELKDQKARHFESSRDLSGSDERPLFLESPAAEGVLLDQLMLDIDTRCHRIQIVQRRENEKKRKCQGLLNIKALG